FGVNPGSLVRAFLQTYILQHRVMGASTITMQVARLRYHLNTHTVIGKMQQMFYALRLEAHYSKDQILEAYLNLAPYGHNIEGIKAASLIYFHKDLAKLNLPEILTLVVIPQNPLARTPHVKSNLVRARNNLFNAWLLQHPEDGIYKAHFTLPLSMYTLPQLPFKAPHWVDHQLKFITSQRIDTTLSLPLQSAIEATVKNYLQQRTAQSIQNVSVLVLDSRDMQIKAMLGSGDYFNKSISGQINGATIARSPGSTLKPFIYALALDQGLIHPATVLKDTPMHFGAYDPENFDYQFMGPIKAQDALIQSRNVPAVYLANLLKTPTLYQFLKSAKTPLREESHYGLGLVLGDAELSMLQLTKLYAMLPNGGVLREPRFTLAQTQDKGTRLLSREASFITLDMLQQNPRPDMLMPNAQTLPVAWKTGTSSGYRDAWSVGVIGPYVLAVWIGNFDNRANPSFVGQKIAAPLFFKIIDTMQRSKRLNIQPLLAQNLNITRIKVCKDSGLLPTHYCRGTFATWFIPGKSPITTDTVFREVMINSKTGKRACVFDSSNQFVTYEFWSSDILELFQRAGINRRVAPPYDKECKLADIHEKGAAPTIQSPQDAFTYTLTKNSTNTIPLKANAESGVNELFWFANTTYLGKSSPDQPILWHATPGHYVLRVVDNFGRADAVKVAVSNL
ncbi:MAG: penicillin-binding protein 1C, partial [Pseudomonadota bacterium]|nr:penicillin-binding protein 1C [Pseudomonadota bacterium]